MMSLFLTYTTPMTSVQVCLTFKQPYGSLCGQGEGVQSPGDVQKSMEVLCHVVSAHRADVVDRFGSCRRQWFFSEAFH